MKERGALSIFAGTINLIIQMINVRGNVVKPISIVAAILAVCSFATGADAADAKRGKFGALPDGTAIEAVTLNNAHGVSARIITWGATLQSLLVPDRQGKAADIVLAYPDMDGYVNRPQFFGATVGRFGNRIAGAAFTIDGKRYELAKNNGPNSLHGGVKGFDKQVWAIAEVKSGPVASVTFTRTSPDGEEGYPGTLKVSVTYALDEKNQLTETYTAKTDKPTYVNLTNHSLFNMAGVASGRNALSQELTVDSDAYTPVEAGLIPTGEIRDVAGTPFDFRTPHLIGERIRDASDAQILIGHGYDHNLVLRGGVTKEPRFALRFADPVDGRVMELWTTEPGIQFYTSNFLNGSLIGVGNLTYRQGDGAAFEPQHFPDSPNQPKFPSTRLDPGQTYRQVTFYRFSTMDH